MTFNPSVVQGRSVLGIQMDRLVTATVAEIVCSSSWPSGRIWDVKLVTDAVKADLNVNKNLNRLDTMLKWRRMVTSGGARCKRAEEQSVRK